MALFGQTDLRTNQFANLNATFVVEGLGKGSCADEEIIFRIVGNEIYQRTIKFRNLNYVC